MLGLVVWAVAAFSFTPLYPITPFPVQSSGGAVQLITPQPQSQPQPHPPPLTLTHTPSQHNTTPHNTPVQSSGGAVQLIAGRDIPAGELLTLSYGNLSNAELLLDYGCVLT